jgi:RNA polymerase sigma factor (sigma-70 family)
MAVSATVRDRTAENRSDTALVLRARDGDKAAEEELYYKYHTQFLCWIRRWLRHKEWAPDFADAAIAKLFEVLPQYKPELSAFSSWAFIVAKTNVIKLIHDLGTERNDVSADELLDEVLPALTGPEDDFVVSRVREEVAHLNGEQRAAVGGQFFEGRTDEELAAELSIPRRRVCYRRQQGLAAMRDRLSDVPFTSIRPETRFSRYYYMMDHDVKANDTALLGGKEGD